MAITQIRTLTYNDEEVYARSHVQGVDGLGKATTTSDGLMSKEDKTKLDGLQNFDPAVLNEATSTKAGIMSAADKSKLDKLNTNSKPSGTVSGGASGSGGTTSTNSSQILNRDTNVWPTESQRINLSKRLSECNGGIVLVWRLDSADNLYHYQFVPKYHVNHSSAKITEVIPTNITSSAIEHCVKVIYVYDTHVVGVAENSSASTKANKIRLHEILEY